jgi:cytochrome c2
LILPVVESPEAVKAGNAFKANCSTCHKLKYIGPALRGVTDRWIRFAVDQKIQEP